MPTSKCATTMSCCCRRKKNWKLKEESGKKRKRKGEEMIPEGKGTTTSKKHPTHRMELEEKEAKTAAIVEVVDARKTPIAVVEERSVAETDGGVQAAVEIGSVEAIPPGAGVAVAAKVVGRDDEQILGRLQMTLAREWGVCQ
mmetsp:Transcript_91023/g.143042  ORF Transcript_91023/g.143042 Transcript_91023/m.143042 type:complete len:142 (-) Transcript_91023:1-426(-)